MNSSLVAERDAVAIGVAGARPEAGSAWISEITTGGMVDFVGEEVDLCRGG